MEVRPDPREGRVRGHTPRYVVGLSRKAAPYHFPYTQAVDDVVDGLRIGRPGLGLTGGQLSRLRSARQPGAHPNGSRERLIHLGCARQMALTCAHGAVPNMHRAYYYDHPSVIRMKTSK
jgi:hypothetical protein